MDATVHNTNNRQRPKRGAVNLQHKKVIFAICLSILMLILWAKVFLGGKKQPVAVNAQALSVVSQNENTIDSPEIIYEELPHIQGRHDILARDVFNSQNWKGFRKPGESGLYAPAESNIAGDSEASSVLTAAVNALELTAIVTDGQYQAFIGNELVFKGDSFNFSFQGQKFRFTVLEIYEDRVKLKCNDIVVVKKIPQPVMSVE